MRGYLCLVGFLWWIARRDAVSAASVLTRNAENNSGSEKNDPTDDSLHEESPRSLKLWLPQDFTKPTTSSGTIDFCQNGRICDPDSVLTSWDLKSLTDIVQKFEQTHLPIPCSASSKHGGTHLPLQLAIGIVKQMDLASFHLEDDREMKAAEFFCRTIHDTWGVGIDVPSCGGGTGIVIFVSTLDRALFISRGGALDRILTDARLDRIIDRRMKPLFRQHLYGEGLKEAIHQITVYLQQGPPSRMERFGLFWKSYGVLLLVAGNLLILVRGVWKKRLARRQYALVTNQLSQLDRARAEALQGQYHTTSCPICLEDFKVKPTETAAPTTTSHDHKQVHSSDPRIATNHTHNANFRESSPTLDATTTANLVGSDGLPVKLLRCGHVFDETCWAEWVSKGSSITRCPICQQDIGGVRGMMAAEENEHEEMALMGQRHERALRQYQRERYFRLMRLSSRYPAFVQPQQIQRWTQSTYDGTLVQDPTFVKSDPKLQTKSGNNSSGARNGGSSSFGGGFSSGGRGSRW